MSQSPRLAVLAVFLFCACISLPEVEQVSETPDAGEPDPHVEDAGTPDASVPDSGTLDSGTLDSGIPDSGVPALTVTFVTSRSVTNSGVQVSATVTGASPDEVEFLVDGVAVATLASPYELLWSAQSLEEGTHVLSVRAILEGRRFTSEARTLIVDRTPPRLVSQTPLAGSRTVSVRQTIQATFSEPLEPTTVNGESVRLLSDAGAVAVEALLTLEGTLLTLQPASPLPADTTLQVSFGSLMDLAGNTLQSLPQDWQWTLPGYLPLGEPQSANTTESSMLCTSLQFAAEGQPVVAWLEGTKLVPSGIHVKQWNGSGWGQLGSVIDITAGHANIFCSLEVDKDGLPTIAWDEYSGSDGRRLYVRHWNGVAWESVGTPGVLLRQQANANHFVFKGTKEGQLSLAFVEVYQGAEQVVVGRWNGSEWNTLGGSLKVNASWNINNLLMDIDAAGNPIVSWIESNSGSNAAAYMRRWNGSSWDVISMPAQTYSYPRDLVIDDSGAPVMDMPVWNGVANSAQPRRWNGSSWVALGNPISTYPGATDSVVTALTLDALGRLTVLIAEPEATGQTSVLHVRRWNGAAWESLGSLVRQNPGLVPVRTPLLAMDSSGQPVLARVEQSETEPGSQTVHVYTPNN